MFAFLKQKMYNVHLFKTEKVQCSFSLKQKMCNVHLFVIIWMHSPIGHDGNNWNRTAPPIWIYLKMELKRLGQSQVEACCLPNQPWLPFEWEEAAQNFKRRQTSSLMWFCHHAHINNNTEPKQQPKPKTKVKIKTRTKETTIRTTPSTSIQI